MRLIQPRPIRPKRPVPVEQVVRLPFPVWHVLYRHQHHAGPSGYDRLSDFVGEDIQVGRFLYWAGETILRPLAIVDARFGGQYEYSRYDWVLERAAMKEMRRDRGAVFHFLYGEKSLRHSVRLARHSRNKLIATLHHPQDHYRWLFRSPHHLSHLSHAIVMSKVLKDFAEDVVGKGRVSVVPYGVDTDFFTPIGARRASQPRRLVFAGFHERDYETLARVVRIVVRSRADAEFVLISKDRQCEDIARDFPGRVRRVSDLSDDEYRRVLQTSDLMVLPLKQSVAVTAVLEAMACGTPVISTEGGIGDYMSSDAGVLCKAGDSDEMAEAVLQLLNDEHLLSGLKIGARKQAMTFAWPIIAQRTANVYRYVADE
jgi:glycosyltransferase involved in cell wall biosynthesis